MTGRSSKNHLTPFVLQSSWPSAAWACITENNVNIFLYSQLHQRSQQTWWQLDCLMCEEMHTLIHSSANQEGSCWRRLKTSLFKLFTLRDYLMIYQLPSGYVKRHAGESQTVYILFSVSKWHFLEIGKKKPTSEVMGFHVTSTNVAASPAQHTTLSAELGLSVMPNVYAGSGWIKSQTDFHLSPDFWIDIPILVACSK